uniref:Cytochrome c oxidase assembly factor 6 homolog n=2 Tax=Chelonoidis abingdonii TaxID=106734 RepID=A0A8C0GF44_CHEAB
AAGHGPLLLASGTLCACNKATFKIHTSARRGTTSPHRPSTSHLQIYFILPVIKMSAPSMEERKACWGAKDEYWKCLDENMEDASRCQKLRCSFESRCPQQWVKYFDKRRDFLKYKEQLQAGEYQPPGTTEKS